MISTAIRAALRVKGRGYLESRPDARDVLRLSAAPVPLRDSAMEMTAGLDRRRQGATSSCATHAIDHAVQPLCASGAGPRGRLYSRRSVQAPYWTARALAGVQNQDGGCYLRDGLKAWNHVGAGTEASAPLKISTINRAPGAEAYRTGHPWRGLRYSRVPMTTETAIVRSVREALAQRRPVVGGWLVDSAFLDDDGPDTIDVQARSSVGGHAMAVLGYDSRDRFRVPNSWPDDWRDGGWCWFTAAMLASARELWVAEGWQ